MTRPNPFQPAPGATPPSLVGREAELASIADATDRAARRSAPTPIIFTGLRGIGKTALLNALSSKVDGEGLILDIEAREGRPLADSVVSGLARMLDHNRWLPKRIAGALDAALRAIPMPTFELPHDLGAISLHGPAAKPLEPSRGLGEWLSRVNDVAHASDRYLAITIDEFHNADVASLRDLVAAVHQSARSDRPILLASAGLPQSQMLLDQLNTYVRRWDHFEVAFLTRAEEIVGLRDPASAVGVSIDDRVVDLIVSESGGYPFFLQKYGSAVWKFESDGRIRFDDELATTIDATRRALEKTYYARSIDGLPERERRFVVALAELGPGSHPLGEVAARLGAPSSSLGSIRMRLIKKDVVFVPGSGRVQFRIPLTERYVMQNRDVLRSSAGT